MIMEAPSKNFDYSNFERIRERAFGRLFWRMKRHCDLQIEPKLHALGYTDFKLSYMQFLGSITEEGVTNNELAKRASVTKQAMSKVVNLLEREGYIHTKKNEADSRSSIICLSERGKALFGDLQDCMLDVKARLSGVVGEDRWEQMIDTMVLLVEDLNKNEF